MGSFDVVTEQDELDTREWRVTLAGEFDLLAAGEFDAVVDQAVGHGARLLTLDLGGVTFIDSSGLRALIRARAALAGADGHLTVAVISETAQRVLEIAGVLEDIQGRTDG